MNRDAAIGVAFLVTAIALWSGNSVIARAAMTSDVPPIALNFLRWSVALAIFASFTAPRVWRLRRLFIRKWWYYAAFGLATVTAYNSAFYTGLQYTTAIQCTLIQAILPVLVLVLAASLLSERISGYRILGVVASIAGAAFIVLRGDPALGQALRLNIGDLWCLVAVLVWAVQVMMLRWKPAEIDMASFMTVIIGFGVVLLAPLYAWEIMSGRVFHPTAANLASLAYLAVFASVFGTALFNSGVIRIGPTSAGYFANLYPVFGAILAIVFLGEIFEWFHAVGGALVLCGIYFATVAHRIARPPSSDTGSS